MDIKQQIEQLRSETLFPPSRDSLLEITEISSEEAKVDPIFTGISHNELTNKQLTELTERSFVNLYRSTLEEMDPTLTVKTVKLHFPDKDRTMFYLYLTTHDGTGALALNKILNEAKFRERDLRYIYRSLKKQHPPPKQLSFLQPEEPSVPSLEQPERPTREECATDMMKRFSGKVLTRREIYKELADEIYFDSEINKAITFLKQKKLVEYTGKLDNKTPIQFSADTGDI